MLFEFIRKSLGSVIRYDLIAVLRVFRYYLAGLQPRFDSRQSAYYYRANWSATSVTLRVPTAPNGRCILQHL